MSKKTMVILVFTNVGIVSVLVMAVGFLADNFNAFGLCLSMVAPVLCGLACAGYTVRGYLKPNYLISIMVVTAVVTMTAHATAYYNIGLEMPTLSNGVVEPLDLSDAFYFSIVTFTTLGYGDIRPTDEYRLLAALEALYGYIFLGLAVGLIANAVSGAGTASEQEPDRETDDGDDAASEH